MNNLDKYNDIFLSTFNVEMNCLNESFTFKEVDSWDSVTHLVLISELENSFDIMFETDDILNFESYLNGIDILKRYGVAF